jgi:hypothetical protein
LRWRPWKEGVPEVQRGPKVVEREEEGESLLHLFTGSEDGVGWESNDLSRKESVFFRLTIILSHRIFGLLKVSQLGLLFFLL